MRIKSTKQFSEWWRKRKADWQFHHLSTWNHPHRGLIVQALKSFPWFSLWEIGCGAGANLVRLVKELPGHQLGGSDINADMIELARKTLTGARFHCENITDMLLSDNSVDVMLSDATLIYVDPFTIKKVLHEMVRSARIAVVLVEFHSTSWWERLLFRLRTGYNIYNYQKLLEDEGCFDTQMYKIPKEIWDDKEWSRYGHIIISKITR